MPGKKVGPIWSHRPSEPEPPPTGIPDYDLPFLGDTMRWGTSVEGDPVGIYSAGGTPSTELERLTHLESATVYNRTFGLMRRFRNWDAGTWNTAAERTLAPRGLWLSEKARLGNGNAVLYDTIDNGDHDAHIRIRADEVKAIHAAVPIPFLLFTFQHEPESEQTAGTHGVPAGHWADTIYGSESAAFAAAYRHYRRVFLNRLLSNSGGAAYTGQLAFGPIFMGASFADTTADNFWPGDASCDFVGADAYNWHPAPGQYAWKEFSNAQRGAAIRDFALAHDLHACIGETGCFEDEPSGYVNGDPPSVTNRWDSTTLNPGGVGSSHPGAGPPFDRFPPDPVLSARDSVSPGIESKAGWIDRMHDWLKLQTFSSGPLDGDYVFQVLCWFDSTGDYNRFSNTSNQAINAYKDLLQDAEFGGTGAPPPPPPTPVAPVVEGTWVIHEANSIAELEGVSATIRNILQTTDVTGFSWRFKWSAFETSFGVWNTALLDAAKAIVEGTGKPLSIRFMAGRNTPSFRKGNTMVFNGTDPGGPNNNGEGEIIPLCFKNDTTENIVFTTGWKAIWDQLVTWCQSNGVNFLHGAWPGLLWSELGYVQQMQNEPGHTWAMVESVHKSLMNYALADASEDFFVEFPVSGHVDLVTVGGVTYNLRNVITAHLETRTQQPFCIIQVNNVDDTLQGLPTGDDDGHPRRGAQMVGLANDYNWSEVYKIVIGGTTAHAEEFAEYLEVYTPSFSGGTSAGLESQITNHAPDVQPPPPPPPTTVHPATGTWSIVQIETLGELTTAESLLETALDIYGVAGIGPRVIATLIEKGRLKVSTTAAAGLTQLLLNGTCPVNIPAGTKLYFEFGTGMSNEVEVTVAAGGYTAGASVLNVQPLPAQVGQGARAGHYDNTVLQNALNIATGKNKKMKPRIIHGKYTPSWVFTDGAQSYVESGNTSPQPIVAGGFNVQFERYWQQITANLFRWAKEKNAAAGKVVVPMIDAGWYSLNYSELYYGPEVQSAAGGTLLTNREPFSAAHRRLIDFGFAMTDATISIGFGLSGHGTLHDYIAGNLAAHMRTVSGVDDSKRIFMQANGWGPGGQWGNALTESGFDATVWPKKVRRGLQDIHPANGGDRTAANWITMYNMAEVDDATYCELYHVQFSTNLATAFQVDAAARNQMILEIKNHFDMRSGTGGGGGGGGGGGAETLGALYKNAPFINLWTHMRTGASAANNTDDFATTMARYYPVNVHAEGAHATYLGDSTKAFSGDTTLARKLVVAGVKFVTGYENGSYVHQGDFSQASELESQAALSIAMLWGGSYKRDVAGVTEGVNRLASTINATIRTITITDALVTKPAGTPNIWPFKASKGLGTITTASRSQDTLNYLGLLRIENEIIGIPVGGITQSGGIITVTNAVRGMFGTTPASHTKPTSGFGPRVFAPVYIGVVSGADAPLAGIPDDVDGSGNAKPLRYAIKIWQNTGADHIAMHAEAKFDKNDAVNAWSGYNAAHFDVSTAFLYNQGDPYGTGQIRQWYDPGNVKMSDADWGDAQIAKHTRILSRVGWENMAILSNSPERFGDDQRVVANLHALRPGAGGRWEGFAKVAEGDTIVDPQFATDLARVIAIWRDNEPIYAWNRWDRQFVGTGNAAAEQRYLRVSYAMWLLGYQEGKPRPVFGAPWGLTRPDDCVFWHLGAPTSIPTDAVDLLDTASGLYVRRFDNGLVLVNATPSSKDWTLGTAHIYYRVASLATGNNVTLASAAEVTGTITVAGREATILARIPA